MSVTVLAERCPQNHRCPSVGVCPAGALKQNGFLAPVVDTSICTGCAKCVKFCPMGAFKPDKK